MGCDGGTIPTRDELVRLKKKPEQKNKDSERQVKWQCCSLSQEQLRDPIVACQLGRLYNKESVLEMLIDRSKFSGVTGADHIKSLKDVKILNLSANPEYEKKSLKGDGYEDKLTAPYICPVVGIEMNGRYRFSFIWSCGCVLSERALKEVKSDVCHKCGKTYAHDDVIPLNPADEELVSLKEQLTAKRLKAKEEKKLKKSLKHKVDETAPAAGDVIMKKAKSDKRTEATDSRPKVMSGEKKYKSIQDDPRASAVFKGLFNTSSAGRKQKSAHWVTYNPQYF